MKIFLCFCLLTFFGCTPSTPAPEPAPRRPFSMNQQAGTLMQQSPEMTDQTEGNDDEIEDPKPKKSKKPKKPKDTENAEGVEVTDPAPAEPELPVSAIDWDGIKSNSTANLYLEPIE